MKPERVPYRFEDTAKLVDQLKFLIEECYISGYLTRLESLSDHIDLFFIRNKRHQEIGEIAASRIKQREGQIVPSSAKCAKRIHEDLDAIQQSYSSLPWLDILYIPSEEPRKIDYAPFVAAKRIILPGLDSQVYSALSNPNQLSAEYNVVQEKLDVARAAGRANELNISRLNRMIRTLTGREPPKFDPFLDIHRGVWEARK